MVNFELQRQAGSHPVRESEPDAWVEETKRRFKHSGDALREAGSGDKAISIGHIRFSLWLDLQRRTDDISDLFERVPDVTWQEEAKRRFEHSGEALGHAHSRQETAAIGHIRLSLWEDMHRDPERR